MASQSNGTDISLVAGADLSAAQFTVVKVNTNGAAVLADADDRDQVGVVQNNPASGQTATVRVYGVTKAKAAGTIASGAVVTSNATGRVIAATAGTMGIGVALAGGASGDVISVLLSPRGVIPA